MDDSTRKTVTITLELTESQRLAVESLLKCWNQLAGRGSSRWTAFYADGDGNFKPNAKIDGREPKYSDLIDPKTFWSKNINFNKEFRIDFDAYGWALQAKEDRGE